MNLSPQKQALNFFMSHALSNALFLWLEFRLFVARRQTLTGVDSANEPHTADSLLKTWFDQSDYDQAGAISSSLYWMLMAGAGMFAMAGVLTVSVMQPINIWWPLWLFAFLPFLMTLVSLLVSLVRKPKTVKGQGLLFRWVNRVGFARFAGHERLLVRWMLWVRQFGLLAFLLSAIAAFFLIAMFQDIQFVWSSTFVRTADGMKIVFDIIALPWSWFYDAPSVSQVAASHAGNLLSAKPMTENTMWTFVLMAVVFYGLLPRLVLVSFSYYRLRKQLARDIEASSDIEQFIVLHQHRESQNALVADKEFSGLKPVEILQATHDLVGWQLTQSDFPLIRILGVGDWQDDESWLTSEQAKRNKPVMMLADIWSTPTGELADCLAELSKKNKSVSLVIVAKQDLDARSETQIRSWQFFAEQQSIELGLGV